MHLQSNRSDPEATETLKGIIRNIYICVVYRRGIYGYDIGFRDEGLGVGFTKLTGTLLGGGYLKYGLSYFRVHIGVSLFWETTT